MSIPSSKNTNQDWRDLYPFQSNYLQIDRWRLHYIDEGQGSPVLMIHGNPTWSFYYRDLINRLCPDYRAIAVDHIGCGWSDKPTDYPYNLSQHIENLVQLIDALEIRGGTLVAHDWGGAIGLGALLERKHSFERVVLLNTAAFPPPFIPFRIRVCRWPVFGKLGVQGMNLFAKAAITMATEQSGGLPGPVAAGMLAPYDNWDHRTAIYRFVKDIPLNQSHPTWHVLEDIESRLREVAHLPIQLIWGMKDWCFRPECLERFRQHWPHAAVHQLENAGHYVMEDEPQQISQRIRDFLGKE